MRTINSHNPSTWLMVLSIVLQCSCCFIKQAVWGIFNAILKWYVTAYLFVCVFVCFVFLLSFFYKQFTLVIWFFFFSEENKIAYWNDLLFNLLCMLYCAILTWFFSFKRRFTSGLVVWARFCRVNSTRAQRPGCNVHKAFLLDGNWSQVTAMLVPCSLSVNFLTFVHQIELSTTCRKIWALVHLNTPCFDTWSKDC